MEPRYVFSKEDVADRRKQNSYDLALPLDAINVLTQIRRSFTGIEELGEEMRTGGQNMQGVVGLFKPDQVGTYVRDINDIYGSHHRAEDLMPIVLYGELRYAFLLAGERRYRGLEWIHKKNLPWTDKCDGKYRCDCRPDLTTEQAISIQVQENQHRVDVPIQEEIAGTWAIYRWELKKNPDLTLAEFARFIHRSTSWLKSSVRFCNLPSSLQELTSQVAYGILVDTAWLAEVHEEVGKPLDESTMKKMVLDAVASRVRASDYHRVIKARVDHLRNGQASLFEEAASDTRSIRRVAAPAMARAFWESDQYLKLMGDLEDKGEFGPEGLISPESDRRVLESLSPGSPIRAMTALAETMERVLPKFERRAAQEGGRNRKKIERGTVVASTLLPTARKLARVEEAVLAHGK